MVRVFSLTMNKRTISTIEQLIEAAGSLKGAAEIVDMTPQELANARTRGNLPTRLFLVQRALLAAADLDAPPTLWKVEPAPNAEQAA
jgi:hypothetical protein